jgi:tRNA (guanine37-N1)-methyltransferase
MMKRAQEKGLLQVTVHQLRAYTHDRHNITDDIPYGGGAGMVMKAEPFLEAADALRAAEQVETENRGIRFLLPSPQGRVFSQSFAEELSRESRRVVFLCGHYEDIDERVRLVLEPEEVSIGDYVLTGGELPALVMIDAATRLIPGVVGDPESVKNDSFSESLLDYPHYTRPPEVRGYSVPDVLVSGNHERIRVWRRKASLRNTYLKRPELLRDRVLSREDAQLLEEVLRESEAHSPVSCGEEERIS